MAYQGVIERYRKYLPVNKNTPVVTLYEGDTPLIPAENLKKYLRQNFNLNLNLSLYLKCEGFNPTGSFKDRGMTVAVSKAKEAKARAVLCASTGNTAASAAAYAAKAGIKCIVLVPSGKVALGKLSQALIYGAKVIALDGNFDQALKLAREICEKYPITLVNSINPYRIEGQKTAAFEIIDVLGKAPDYQFMPVGNAGNITAYWKGYREFANGKFQFTVHSSEFIERKRKLSTINYQLSTRGKLPRMMGFQAEGAAPIVKGHPIKKPKTIATAIRIGNPASWEGAVRARDESGGVIDTVSDKEIIRAYKLLASTEGLFVEPASAASVAGLIKYVKKGFFTQSPIVVCILTGHGLKDPKQAIKISLKPKIVPAKLNSVLKEIGI